MKNARAFVLAFFLMLFYDLSSPADLEVFMTVTGGLTADDEALLCALLGKVEQPYSRVLTEALLAKIPAIAVEMVLRRWMKGTLQVLLTRREEDPHDPWRLLWNCPGTVLRVTDVRGVPDAIKRLADEEVGAPFSWFRHVYADTAPDFATRALVLQLVHVGGLPQGEQGKGEWFDVDKLPADIVRQHPAMIHRVISWSQESARSNA